MSANDIIFINRTNFKVYYNGCADNPTDFKEDFIGQGKTLDEAIDIAENHLGDNFVPEYGITFFKTKEPYESL